LKTKILVLLELATDATVLKKSSAGAHQLEFVEREEIFMLGASISW
jgi:hypothetical protein